MQRQMSEGDPTATTDTRECDQEAAAEATTTTMLGSSSTATVAPKQQTGQRGFGITPSTEPSGWGIKKNAKGESCGWGGYGGRQTSAERAREVFLARIEDAEQRKLKAEMDFDEALGAYNEADGRRDAASADHQAAGSYQHTATRDRQRSVEDIHSAKDQLRDYDEEMRWLGEEEKDE